MLLVSPAETAKFCSPPLATVASVPLVVMTVLCLTTFAQPWLCAMSSAGSASPARSSRRHGRGAAEEIVADEEVAGRVGQLAGPADADGVAARLVVLDEIEVDADVRRAIEPAADGHEGLDLAGVERRDRVDARDVPLGADAAVDEEARADAAQADADVALEQLLHFVLDELGAAREDVDHPADVLAVLLDEQERRRAGVQADDDELAAVGGQLRHR